MGCTVSRPEGLFSTKDATIEDCFASSALDFVSSSSVSRTLSLPTPPVHHPPLKKGDTHHLVSLTSTTYGSLLLLDQSSSDHHQSKTLALESETQESASPVSVINAWELMAGLDDFDCSSKPNKGSFLERSFSVRHDSSSSNKPFFARTGSVKKLCSSFEATRLDNSDSNSNSNLIGEGKVKKLCNSFEPSADPGENNNSSMKPLWKHMSEEMLLADMDPNVVSSFRRAISSRQLGMNQSKMVRPSVGSSSRFSPLSEYRSRLPGTEDKIVVYFTSLRGIRRTYEDCCAVRNIFRGFRVSVDERDISMDSAYRRELQNVLGEKTFSLPQIFIRSRYIGGAEEIKQLHEMGDLIKLLEGFPLRDPRFVCESCGDARFVPCLNCNGSRKVFDEDEEQLRRCPECNENGLIRCPSCSS
ncbi:uncharacterized protein At3g28850-like [Telopea speciosissima]|uniref:uncharacterized protein At3g28850-like n=1 Tax=Telopea speciosissima TaxID=54955 RepID=UPI001CC44CAF|nr:uncharacterized protein At3g28850-like [Telopea speciosissima]